MSSEINPAASPISPSSLKQKLKSSLRLPWLCHNSRRHHQLIALSASTSTPLPTPTSPSLTANNHSKSGLSRTSSSTWFNSPELKDKCRDFIKRIGYGTGHNRSHSHGHGHGHHGQGRRRRNSADFRYDPASYALNFDEGCDGRQLDEFPFRNFSARLPPSPTATSPREITTYKL